MAKDFLNVIERALMMGVSDTINDVVTGDVFVYGEFPETEDLKFPALIVQHTGSGFEEQFIGQKTTLGSVGTGEIYGISYTIHVIVDKETTIKIDTTGNGTPDTDYKQRRLLNWLMLNVANALQDIDWDTYEEEDLEILERHVLAWNDIGFMPQVDWYGASCRMSIVFLNKR